MAYCSPDDINIGNVQLPRGLNKQAYVDAAAEEMDAELGKVYVLPLTPSSAIASNTWAGKYLKKINKFLAIGRIVIDSASGGEDNSLNSYGYYHLKTAMDALAALVSGSITLTDVEKLDVEPNTSGPQVENRDAGSYVDAFYNTPLPESENNVYPARPVLPWL